MEHKTLRKWVMIVFIIVVLTVTNCLCIVCHPNQGFKFANCKEHKNGNCSHMFSEHYNNTCLTSILKNTTECRSWIFPENKVSTAVANILDINSYCFNKEFFTLPAFNISLKYNSTVQWKGVFMRFWNEDYNFALCVSMTISNFSPIHKATELFFDCPWLNESLIGKKVELQYSGESEDNAVSGRYSFIVPSISYSTHLSVYEQVSYVDLTSWPEVTMTINKCDPSLNVKEYFIKLCDCFQDHSDCTLLSYISTNTTPGHITIHKNMQYYYGCFYFLTEAYSENCRNGLCFVSKSPNLNRECNNTYIYIIAACVLVAVFIISFKAAVEWKYHRFVVKQQDMTSVPVLILYDAVNRNHVQCVCALAELLTMYLNFDVKVDVNEPDPFLWLENVMDTVNNIMYIVSPRGSHNYESVHTDLHNVALHNTIEIIANKRHDIKVVTVLLPYSHSSNIPLELKYSEQFELPKQLPKFLFRLNNHKFILNYFLYKKFSERQLKLHGNKLQECIEETKRELNCVNEHGKNHEAVSLTNDTLFDSSIEEYDDITNDAEIIACNNETATFDTHHGNNGFALCELDLSGTKNSDESERRRGDSVQTGIKFYHMNLKL